MFRVIWQCDPMHGNTEVRRGWKTRDVRAIKEEILETIQVHWDNQSRLHGIHLEATGADVNECVDGSCDEELGRRYESACDPRLNPEQARDVIEFVNMVLVQGKRQGSASRMSSDTSFGNDGGHSEDSIDSFWGLEN